MSGPDGATLVPYLAESMPTVSADGMTYTFTLRKGLKYSDGAAGQGERLQVHDRARLQDRLAGRRLLLGDHGVSGPNGFAKTKKGDITGITTDDAARTITIKLEQPQGDFLNILAIEFARFVPAGTPARTSRRTRFPRRART